MIKNFIKKLPQRSQKTLAVAYIFRALARAGVHRTVRLMRYLAPLGWDVTVLTANKSYYPFNSPVDRELSKKIPAAVKINPPKFFTARQARCAAAPLKCWKKNSCLAPMASF